jgi:hypothetical protein
MATSLRSWFHLGSLLVLASWVGGACSRDQTATPTGALTGTLPPLVGVGSATRVTLTAADGQSYTTTPTAQTGTFSFPSLPAGNYLLTFSTPLYATFPVQVPVVIKAGSTTTPALPALTHDGKVRGTMRWTLGGITYNASQFLGLLNSSFVLTGIYTTGPVATTMTSDISLSLPEADDVGPIFAGAGNYPFGLRRIGSSGQYTYYAAGTQAAFVRYLTPRFGQQTGLIALTRFDVTQGIASGTFSFTATDGGALNTSQVVLSNGIFEVTF